MRLSLPWECVGDNPIVCNPSIRQKSVHSCAHQIVLSGDGMLQACSLAFETHPEGFTVSPRPNELLIATRSEHITQKCPGGDVAHEEVPAGTYRVQWAGQCTVAGRLRSVTGVRSTTLNLNPIL